jgi:SPP1 family phage portal protein
MITIKEIIQDADSSSRLNFVAKEVNNYKNSKQYENIVLANAYYTNDGTDIQSRVRTIAGVETTNLTNNKFSHPFLNEIVEQKVSYMLSNGISIKSDDNLKYQEIIEVFFNDMFNQRIQNMGRYAILGGLSWIQIFYNELGEFKFKRIPSEQVIPYWSDDEKMEIDAVIRFYDLEDPVLYTTETYAEFWTKEFVYYYKGSNGSINGVDHSKGANGVGSHFSEINTIENIDGVQTNINGKLWDKIPFIPFKYNSFMLPLLPLIKSLIDGYNIITSDMANNVNDIPNNLMIVKGYQSPDAEGQITVKKAIKEANIIHLDSDGDVSNLKMDMDSQLPEKTLERLQKDIYRFGKSVDNQSSAIGNQSGVALKFLYAGLDLDCSILSQNFKTAISELLYFYNQHLLNTNQGDFTQEKINIEFNQNMVINQTDLIDNIVKSVGLISNETLLQEHPFVVDVSAELELLKKQSEVDNLDMGFNNVENKA